MGLVRRAAIACASSAMLAFACMSPTEITLEISTDLSCTDLQGVSIAVGRASDFETDLPFTVTQQCSADGTIGTFVVLPKSIDEEVAIRVVGGYRSSVEACASPWGSGCIVSRRILRTVPHTPLFLPIRLSASCAGISCDPQSTCVNGACTPASIPDPTTCETPSGCPLDGGGGGLFGVECGDMSGAQAGSPWPMAGACPRHLSRSPYHGTTHQPSVAWTSPSPNGGTLLSIPVVSNDGTVFVGLDDGHGLALDLATGAQRWSVLLGPQVSGNAGIGADGTFVISGVQNLYGVDGTTHLARWTQPKGADLTIGPGNVSYSGMNDSLAAVDVASGTLLWKTPVTTTASVTFSAPAIGPDGTLYISATDGTFAAVDPTSHTIKWQKALVGYGVPLVTPDGNVYVANNNATAPIYAFDASGNPLWSAAGATSSCLALGRDGSLVVGGGDGFQGLDPVTGTLRWSYVSLSPLASCPIVDAANLVFGITQTGDVLAVDPKNPLAEIWKVNVPTAFEMSMAADGTLLVIATDGTLTALR